MPDRYALTARVGPALLVAAPLITLAVAVGLSTSPAALGGAAVLAIFSFAAGETVRRCGQRLEPQLWAMWGGAPTQHALRWRSGHGAEETARRHAELTSATGVPLPGPADEAADPAAADRVYDQAIRRLRDMTRDPAEFPLIHAENISYGFARNTLAVKSAAIASSSVTVLACAVLMLVRDGTVAERASGLAPPAIVAIGLLAWFAFAVRAAWVRPIAERYAERLLGGAAKLAPQHAP